MKTSTNNLIATLATVASLLVASNVMAGVKNGNSGGPHPRPQPTSISVANKYGVSTTVLGNGTTKNENSGTAQKYGNGLGKTLGTDKGLQNTINTINGTGRNETTVFGGTLKNGPPPKGCKPCHDGHWYCEHRCSYTWEGCSREVLYGEYIVVPGDTFETIAQKVYATNANVLFLASFNGLPVNVALVPGQVLKMPSI